MFCVRVFPIFFLTFFFMIIGRAQSDAKDTVGFFNSQNFLGDTLFIKAQYVECGEFGGHTEVSKIYIDKNEFYISYEKFSADCKTLRGNFGKPKQTLINTVTKKLLDKDKQFIKKFFHQLVDEKFIEPAPMHVGYIFEMKKSDNTLNLFVYTWTTNAIDDYEQLIKGIFD